VKAEAASNWRRSVGFGLVIVLAGAGAYLNSFSGQFVYDDLPAITQNPYLRSLRPTWPQMWAPADTTLAGRPVVAFSFAVNYALGGLEPWGYHLVNLAIHLANGLLLWDILRRTLAGNTVAGRRGFVGPHLAFVTALLWVVHPLQTESVTYISTRTESLVGFFLLLILYCTIRAAGSARGRLWQVGAVLAGWLASGSKETAAVGPVLVLLYDRTFLSGSLLAALRRRPWLYLGLATSWIPLALLVAGGPRAASVGFHLEHLRPVQYLLTQPGVILHYLRLSFWPHPLALCYDGWPIAGSIVAALPAAAAIGGLLLATLWGLWRRPPLGFGGAWFFLLLAPTSSVVPIVTEVAAERRMYLPLAAVICLTVVSLSGLLSRLAWKPRLRSGLAGLLTVAAVAAGVVLTARRNAEYRSPEGIWRSVLRHYPTSRGAHLSLATLLYQQGRSQEGVDLLEAYLPRDPDDSDLHYHLAFGLAQLNRWAEAAEHYARCLELNPADYKARTNYAAMLVSLGRYDQARSELLGSLARQPRQALAYFQLGRISEAERQPEQAADYYATGLELDPSNAQAHFRLAVVLAAVGRKFQALGHLEQAIHLEPRLTEAGELMSQLRAEGQVTTQPSRSGLGGP